MNTKLKEIRKKMGISQLELALRVSKEIGAKPSRWTIQLIECGYRVPSKQEVSVLSKVLGVKRKDLFHDNEISK